MRALALAAALLVSAPALARGGRLEPVTYPDRYALGLLLGEPFGFSLKHYQGAHAWDAYVGFYSPGLRFGGDWLWNLGRLERQPKFDLDLYAGVGPFVGTFTGPCGPGFWRYSCNGDAYLGARVPFGLEMMLRQAPLTFGLEVAPGLGIASGGAGLLLDFAFVVRFLL